MFNLFTPILFHTETFSFMYRYSLHTLDSLLSLFSHCHVIICVNQSGVRHQRQVKCEVVNVTFVNLVVLRDDRTKFVFAVLQSPRASERMQPSLIILIPSLSLFDFEFGQFEREAKRTDEIFRSNRDYFSSR